jgi:hypothetical protein
MFSKMDILALSIMLPYTLMIVIGIHYYEARLKREAKIWANKFENLASSFRNDIKNIDIDNEALKRQVLALKSQLAGDPREIQYESSIYKSNTWDTSMYETQVDFE